MRMCSDALFDLVANSRLSKPAYFETEFLPTLSIKIQELALAGPLAPLGAPCWKSFLNFLATSLRERILPVPVVFLRFAFSPQLSIHFVRTFLRKGHLFRSRSTHTAESSPKGSHMTSKCVFEYVKNGDH